MKKHVLLLVVSLVFAVGARAQDVLNLEQAIAIGTDVSTQVGQAREQLQVSRQNVLNSWGAFLPNLTFNANVGKAFLGPTQSISFDSSGRPVQSSGFDYNNYSMGFNSSMVLFDWGANIKNLQSAQASAQASEYGLQYQKDNITARVIREYYSLVRDEYLILVEEESVRAAQRNLDQVQAFFAIGSNTKADVLQAQVRLGNTQLALITARNNAEISRAALATTLNLPINQSLEVDTSLTMTPVSPDLDTEIQYMLEHRSDLLGTEKNVDAAKNNLTATRNSRWPTIGAGWNYNWNDRQFSTIENVFTKDYSWSIGIGLNWNIFDRYQIKSSILNAQAQERIAEYTFQQAKLDAVLEVKTIILSLKEAEERARVAKETTDQGKENLRLAEERYRVGAGTILETNDAQVTLTRARSDLVRALCDHRIARAALQLATGRPVKVE
jgi:outer membrane protein